MALMSALTQMASRPQRLMVAAENFSAAPSRAKICPAMTSWMIRAKGMTVMAVVVVRTMQEIICDNGGNEKGQGIGPQKDQEEGDKELQNGGCNDAFFNEVIPVYEPYDQGHRDGLRKAEAGFIEPVGRQVGAHVEAGPVVVL